MPSIEDFKKFEFRVAEILDVKDHPNADRLYVLEILVGSDKKQIVAGIKKNYTADELKGKKIVIINNLEPAVIRGVESQGMLLAARDENLLSVIIPERNVASGASIS
ncbi:MAG TPA: methionine--tRNA ligase subunit beta [Candidatus Omnitrophota bacterium]|nr:methionine--tRNA ligase subunit beta [Candidatus Omnitrophota bacterium]